LSAIALALLAVGLLAFAGPSVRFGLLPYSVGLMMLPAAGAIGLLAAVVGMVSLVRGRGVAAPLLGVLLGIVALAVPIGGYIMARSVPPIHDISTDPKEQTEAQRLAYPEVQPLRLTVAPNVAFERAKGAVEEMGWQIAREDPSAGRIEAVATTFWFGFKDDVVIRVSAEGTGSRIDVRSKSRVGASDLGTNARRIRAYQERLQ
jgi:uncharacterized protein (DUF1499 family)